MRSRRGTGPSPTAVRIDVGTLTSIRRPCGRSVAVCQPSRGTPRPCAVISAPSATARPSRPRPVAVTRCALVRHAPELELLAALKRAVEFDDYLGDHAPHHGLDRHDDSLRIEGFGYSCGKGLGEARGALPDDADDAATAGLGPALRARRGGRGGRGRPDGEALGPRTRSRAGETPVSASRSRFESRVARPSAVGPGEPATRG